MSLLQNISLFIAGLTLLLLGAQALLHATKALSLFFSVSMLALSLTLIAFGTSTPEIFVSVIASMKGQQELALGNIIGSCLFNLYGILGISALISPIRVRSRLIWVDLPIMCAASILLYVISLVFPFNRLVGAFLLFCALVYVLFSLRLKDEAAAEIEQSEIAIQKGSPKWIFAFYGTLFVAACFFLFIGAELMVFSSTKIARAFLVSELLIGLTIVAFGTSLPELGASFAAIKQGEQDVIAANVLASNTFNLLAVVGFCALFSPDSLSFDPKIWEIDYPFMMGSFFLMFPILGFGEKIGRLKAVFLLALFFCYFILRS